MDFKQITREIRIDASPEVTYEVISQPDHLRHWWPDEAELTPMVGSEGQVVFGDPSSPDAKVVAVTVVEADPPRRFAFRWTHDAGTSATPDNSLLVTFDLEPDGDGTLLRFRETGFLLRGWTDERVAEQYAEHQAGWDTFLPRLVPYAARVATS